jgi:hypothetical protein
MIEVERLAVDDPHLDAALPQVRGQMGEADSWPLAAALFQIFERRLRRDDQQNPGHMDVLASGARPRRGA